MMAAAGPPSISCFLPLLETVEDSAAGHSEQTDAYLTIASRLSGEEGRQFLPAVEKYFSRLCKTILIHISSPDPELSQAALQALGFCVYHSHFMPGDTELFAAEILTALCSLMTKSSDKNTCTRALWVASKQNFPADIVAKKVPMVLDSLEITWSRTEIQSVVMEHEALNVIIRMLEQVPAQMGERAVQWAKMVIPLVVHSTSKLRLRAAAAMEIGMPLLLAKQREVAAIIEPMMSSKLIPELQKLFKSKNETNVLKLWPLFIKLLGKLLHRGGPFINSLLQLEELGFRSSSPTVKKIAFIAWKSLIDNFALNPDILCSAKRMKLIMQPLLSISLRTETLMLTKVEVWWHLVIQLGPNLSSNFDQVSVPLLQTTIVSDSSSSSSSIPGTPRAAVPNGSVAPATPKHSAQSFNSSANTPRLSLNSSMEASSTYPSIQLLGLEMLLHYLLGPEAAPTAAKHKLMLSLEPLHQPLLSGSSSFTKHANVLISNIRDGFINIGRDAPESLLTLIWINLVRFVSLTVESGAKKDRQGSEVLTLMLQALQSIVSSEVLPADRVLVLFEATVKGIPQKVLGSASYQVGKMDVLNGTPALFLLLLFFNSSMLPSYLQDERFFQCLQTLVGCGLSGPASPLAFAEAVLGAMSRSAGSLQDKEQLWRMWNLLVSPLTETITQTNEVNQGDALEHNFTAMHSALMFPIMHLLHGPPLPQVTQKSLLTLWSRLYKVFARCSALVATAEENICCEELCVKMTAAVEREALAVPATLSSVSTFLHVMVDCVDFSPYTPNFQQKIKAPHTPVSWTRKRNRNLGNLSTFQSLLVDCLQLYLVAPETQSEATGSALVSILMTLFSNLVLNNAVREILTVLVQPLTLLYKHAGETSKFSSSLQEKLEKLAADVLGCLQTRSTLSCDSELLELLTPLLCVLFTHKNKHLRTTVTQFWNSTFGNAVSLAYPEEIRPVLSQVKQKIPIMLPGFEAVGVPGELSEQFSSESSQLEMKLSGMPLSSSGKRDSLLGKVPQSNHQSSPMTSKPVSTKLDFSSPKPPRRAVLEEEASIDFVFIPPETKERVLTEHQKEMKRTKRVDIPAMYNNLDASLDTSVFTQFTQSQDNSIDQPLSKLPDSETEKVSLKDEKSGDTADPVSPKDEAAEKPLNQTGTLDTKPEGEAEEESPNVSASSDLVSGTPQKPSSRRQSFITLETYAEGKPPNPSSSFTGLLLKTPKIKKSSPKDSFSHDSPELEKTSSLRSLSQTPDSPWRPEEFTNSEPVRLIEKPDLKDSPQVEKTRSQDSLTPEFLRRPEESETKGSSDKLPSNGTEEEDVIPDTQTEAEEYASSQDEASENGLEDSQLAESKQPGSQDADDNSDKKKAIKQRRSGKTMATPVIKNRPNTRSKLAFEENIGRSSLRSRSRESSQTNSPGTPKKKFKLFNNLKDYMDKPERRRKSAGDLENSQTSTQSDGESQSQRKRGRPRKSGKETVEQDSTSQPVEEVDSQAAEASPQTETKSQDAEEKSTDEQNVPSSQTECQLNDPHLDTSTPAEPNGGPANQIGHQDVTMETEDENIDQESSQTAPRRSRRSKTPSEASEPESVLEPRRRSQTSTPVLSQADSGSAGNTGRSKLQRELLVSLPSWTCAALQSLNISEVSLNQSRSSIRGSSPASAGSVESSESESSEAKTISHISKRKAKRKRPLLQSPLVSGSQENGNASQAAEDRGSEESLETKGLEEPQETQNSQELLDTQELKEALKTQDPEALLETQGQDEPLENQNTQQLLEDSGNLDEETKDTSALETHQSDESLSNKEPRDSEPINEDIEEPEPERNENQNQSVEASATTLDENGELDISEPTEEKVDPFVKEASAETDSDHQEISPGLEEHTANEDGTEQPTDTKNLLEPEKDSEIAGDIESNPMEVNNQQTEVAAGFLEPSALESPKKLKDQGALTGPDVGQSPSDGRLRGSWSPSASPSTSILKKAQKRQHEVETPSPLVKSRRVSFADPIQQHETADDIDRRSPAIRTSSPRRSKTTGLQTKLITTPTKGVLVLSPRNLNNSGYKSSKKCLISEMSEEPRAVSKHCIYPALVGCSAPVEAVLPQITSSVWSRGFGQLVRARNIKTVGDLSAMTPSQIKTLPICSPKISNVKKALKTYEQQRKGQSDELKSFDETERMTSELGETETQSTEEDKPSEEKNAELMNDSEAADVKREPTASVTQIPDGPDGLLSAMKDLVEQATPQKISRFTPQQLMEMYDELGGVMRNVVVEMQTRICSQTPAL